MLGPKLGMGPAVAQAGRMLKCDERKVDNCPDSCCAIIPCRLCLLLTDLYNEKFWGFATYRPELDGWYGFIKDLEFFAKWERDPYSDLCEFIVTLAGNEIFRGSCYGGSVTCEDPGASAFVDDLGTLEWFIHKKRPLPYVIEPETGCRVNFCSTCECTPWELCATITSALGGSCKGTLSDQTYPFDVCNGPVWSGTIPCEPDDIHLTVYLYRDEYTGECMVDGSFGDTPLDAKSVGCDVVAEWILPSGIRINVSPKYCDCEVVPFSDCCFPRCPPLEVVPGPYGGLIEQTGSCDNPLPVTLQIDLFGSSPDGGDGSCFDGSGTLTYRTPISYPITGTNCWKGVVSGFCTDCNGNSVPWSLAISVCCNDEGRFVVAWEAVSTPCQNESALTIDGICDPVLLDGCFPESITACFTGCLYDVTPIPSPTFDVCFQIYEMP